MGLLSRLRHATRALVGRLTGRAPEPPPPFEPPDYGGGGGGGPIYDDDDRESRLPDGWVLVGLYHHGMKTQRIHATDDTEVTDREIHQADAQIVWFEAAGDDGYRWIHGATGWDSLDDQITRTIMVVSNVE